MAAVEAERKDEQTLANERQKLQEHFRGLAAKEQMHGWDTFWREKVTPWDHHEPNPALVDALKDRPHLFGSAFRAGNDTKIGDRKKAFVPGCGRGYDVFLFASYGFNAVGLDAAPTAKEAALKFSSEEDIDQNYPLQSVKDGRGETRFITGDFFEDNFLSETHGVGGSPESRTFDFIYDNTFLCALPPELRPKWAARMSKLLSPDGRLICMEYPLGKDPKSGGPPHGLSRELYEEMLARPGDEIKYDEAGHVQRRGDVENASNALVKVEDWDPARSFNGQKGKLMMSVWKHI